MALNDLCGPYLGSRNGRMSPVGYTPADGTFAFVFGTDATGETGEIETGDSFEISQSVDFTTLTLVEFQIRFRQPDNTATGTSFFFEVSVGATTLPPIEPAQGETIDFIKRTVRVDQFTGTHNLIFRVQAK